MADAAPRAKTWLLGLNFALVIFISAFLLFQVQPLISKFILPWFGGGPAVWTTCMLFFQTLLFAGYAYAHFSVKRLKPATQGLLHVILLVTALAVSLPSIAPSSSWKPEDSHYPTWRIMALLAVNVGLPYLLLSATGPLLQAWFARTFVGRSPYRLYALSNVGSLLGLLSYPFLVEPALDSYAQSSFWSWGFAIFVVLCGLAAIHIWRMDRAPSVPAAPDVVPAKLAATTSEQAPAWHQPLLWIVLPAFASTMFLATTNHVCQDVAVIPFLWVIPLSLYLLSFIIAFDHERWYVRPVFAIAGLAFLYLASGTPDFETELGSGESKTKITLLNFTKEAVEWWRRPSADAEVDQDEGDKSADTSAGEIPESDYTFDPEVDYVGELVIHFAALFCVCMICHGELVRIRPPPAYLTSFYLMISAGGAVGGIFVSLIAPVIFDTFFEWKLSIFGGLILTAVTFLLSTGIFQHFDEASGPRGGGDRWSFGLWLATLLLVAVPWLVLSGIAWSDLMKLHRPDEDEVIARVRNFYGAVRVEEESDEDPESGESIPFSRTLYNGRIIHGLQFLDDDRRLPTTYYSTDSGVGRAIGYFKSQPDMRVGAVGLGTGTLAAYNVEKGHYFRFYEINPEVEDLAWNYFTYLKNAAGTVEVVLGDARLSLEREAQSDPQRFDVLVLDAFSGDAIPAHLLTREAFEIYREHVDLNEGIIAVHISNRYIDLVPVVRGLTEHFNLGSVRIHVDGEGRGAYSSEWICVTNNRVFLETYADNDEYDGKRLPAFMFYASPRDEDGALTGPHAAFATIRSWPRAILWTDAHSNLFDIVMRKEED
ncbi:MAG TPA: fused MFS/spermidine synthase [Pirellulales bacterium]|jgi:MFS family permease|nr:fused MFS/spermidine synthase [Pirellulales bacterium]